MPVKTVASVFLRPTTRPVIDATLNKRPKYDWINLNNFHLWTKDVQYLLSEAIAIRTKTNSGALRILSDISSFNSFLNRSNAFILFSMSISLLFWSLLLSSTCYFSFKSCISFAFNRSSNEFWSDFLSISLMISLFKESFTF